MKRYTEMADNFYMVEESEGEWVKYEDVKKLIEELEKYKKIADHQKAILNEIHCILEIPHDLPGALTY